MKFIATAAALLLTACAAQSGPAPGFPTSPYEPGARYCGGMVAGPSQSCGMGEYCHRNIRDMCGAADAPGVCRPLPQSCTYIYKPVCGCDGQTYSSECGANFIGVSAAYAGECR